MTKLYKILFIKLKEFVFEKTLYKITINMIIVKYDVFF